MVDAAQDLPKFDVVRVEPDGSATIAGNAAAGALVSVRVDGAEVITAAADASGKFAVLFNLPASSVPRLLSLAATTADGQILIGPDTVALAPTMAPTVAADAAPEAALPAPPAALLVTEAGVEVLQSGVPVTPEIAANVSIDTISYAPSGAVQLSGRGQGAAFVRLYLDGVDVATVPVAADGQWATELADVAPGIYTLRADQIGADGKVTSRFETPFKRETLEALAAVAAPAAPVVAAVAPAAVEPAAVEPVAVEPVAVEPAAAEPVAEPAPVVAAVPETALAEQDPMAAETPAPDAAAVAAVAPAAVATVAPAAQAAQAAEPAPAPAAEIATAAPAAAPALVSITVQPGFTLWGIAKAQMGDGVMYVQVFEANKDKIRDPDLIYPGQVFTMPAAN